FERLESCEYRGWLRLAARLGWNPARHGFEGWLRTSVADPRIVFPDQELTNLVVDSFEAAVRRLHLPPGRQGEDALTRLDPNDWRLVRRSARGVRQVPLATGGGRRNGPRDYLKRVAQEHPDRLILRTGALATRVLFDEGNRAVGVEYRSGRGLYRAD